MKAIYLPHLGGAEALAYGDLPAPRAQSGHVLVRVHAAAVTPTELQWFPTSHTPDGGPRPFPVIPGHEFSGTVDEVGPETDGVCVGDAVYGMNDWFAQGAQAEFVVAPVAMVAPKPVTVSHARAAVVPISALTAWQALTERARLRPRERILIHGAAGGVGLFAVQIAHAAGALVVATASSANVEFVAGLGADTVIDYRRSPFESAAGQV
ncbi:MAG: NADP-dependent oxidoreductase, partial [Solirubrobacteraceae bacterium]